MQRASITGLIETIFFIMVFYYVFKFLAKIFLPLLIKKAVEKATDNLKQQQNNYKDDSFWDKNKNEKRSEGKNKVGDYIDYEELE